MRRFPPPRSGVRRASPAPASGRKKQPRIALPAGSGLGPGRFPRAAVPLPVRGKGRGLDGHALGIRIPPARAGNACSDRLFLFLDRITPAYAGKRMSRLPTTTSKPDYPRIYGEKAPCPQTEACRCGAPPRMRGTVLFCVIPVGMPPHGSPLPMQGKDLLRSPGGRKERITLAHAGKRAAPPPRCPGAEDHPRACGEKETDSSIAKRNSGSPRVCGEKRSASADQSNS